ASQIAPGIGPAVDQFFERALARDPDARFQSAREMAEALAALAALEGAGATKLQTWSGVHTGASLGLSTAQMQRTDGAVAAASGAVPVPTNVLPPQRSRTGLVVVVGLIVVLSVGIGAFAALRNRAPDPVAPSSANPESPKPTTTAEVVPPPS